MPLKRKIFVIAPVNVKADIERKAFEAFKAGSIPRIPIGKLRGIKGARVTRKGIIINEEANPLLQQMRIAAVLIKHPLEVARPGAERLALIRQLRQLGYRVAVPKYEMFKGSKFYEKARKHARLFPAEPSITAKAMVGGKEIKEVTSSALWARDLWTKVEGRRVKRFSKAGEEAFGEGGKIVQVSKNCFIASSMLKENPKVKELQNKGIRFFFTSHGEAFNAALTRFLGRKAYVMYDHPDLFVGAVGKVLLADHDFFRQNRDSLREAARNAELRIVYVPEKEADLHPANFLLLEENKALVDKDAVETIRVLRENGVEVIPTTHSIRANRNAGGGVRCIVNEL